MKVRGEAPRCCEACGSGPVIHGGHFRQVRRHGWYSYHCGRRWNPEHGWSCRSAWCRAQELEKKVRELRRENRRLKRAGERVRNR